MSSRNRIACPIFFLAFAALATTNVRAEEHIVPLVPASCLGQSSGCERYLAASDDIVGAGHAKSDVGGQDPRFRAAMIGYITAAGADVAVSMYQIGRGTAREGGFGAWWQDSPVAFAVSKSAMTALFAFGLEQLHRTKPKTAFILAMVGTGVEVSLTARAARMNGQ